MVDSLDLVTSEHEGLDGPLLVIGWVDLGGDGGDDAEVVAGTLDSPPEVGAGVDGLESSVGEDNVHGDELVGNETIVALQPAMATTKGGTQIADTLAGASHGLLVGSPEGLGDKLGLGAAEYGGGEARGGDSYSRELLNSNVDTTVQPAKGGDGAVDAIEDEEGNAILVCPFDL